MAGWLAERWSRPPPAPRARDAAAAGGEITAAAAIPEAPPREAEALLGLGPGLTPAGDDFIGGAVLALHVLGRTGLARRLGEWALAESRERTGIISRAHLHAAARGMGAEPVHRALHCLLVPGAPGLDATLADTAAIGHSSGHDTLAGAVCVLDVAARSPC